MKKHPNYESLKAGDILVADNGFTCIPPGTPIMVTLTRRCRFVRSLLRR
jgi:predicted nuclease with RNAse H fold